MIYELGRDPLVLKVLADERRVLIVYCLLGGRSGRERRPSSE